MGELSAAQPTVAMRSNKRVGILRISDPNDSGRIGLKQGQPGKIVVRKIDFCKSFYYSSLVSCFACGEAGFRKRTLCMIGLS